MKISMLPYKGSRDFYPEQFAIRKYIFDTFEKVCKRYGYVQYDGPFLESTEIYKAKSGQEIVDEQLYSFVDKGNREIAIRPEMTPTLARMIAAKNKELTRPIRWFSIPNVWRYERPQKGRLREHYQLNVDIYGVDNVMAEAEIISIVIDILKDFGANKDMFKVKINNRKLIQELFTKLQIDTDKHEKIFKIIDKKLKISEQEFKALLQNQIQLSKDLTDTICHYLDNPNDIFKYLGDMSNNVREVKNLFEIIKKSGYDEYIQFDPSIVRGLDYYTSFVFELFDLNPNNNRALCGGGKYQDLLKIFINQSETAVGFGMGDVTILNFLTEWNLLPKLKTETEYLVTVWPSENDQKFFNVSNQTAQFLRENNKNCILWLENNTKIDKQVKFALKNNISKVVIIGENELNNESITIKDLHINKQQTLTLKDFYKLIQT